MELTTILNQCYRFSGFVYERARWSADQKSIEVRVRPRSGSDPTCSGCQQRSPGYDRLEERRFEFIPLWQREASTDQDVHAVSGALGAQAVLEGGGGVLSNFLGEGLRLGGIRRAVGAEASNAGTDLRPGSGRTSICQGTKISDLGVSDR